MISRLESKAVAALWVLGAAFAFSLLYASGKLTGGLVPAIQIVFIRYVSGFATVAGIAAARRQSLNTLLAGGRRHLHLLRALCGVGGGACSIWGATHMPLADASALALLQGVFTMALAVLLLRERIVLMQGVAAALCVLGALVIVRGNTGAAVTVDPDPLNNAWAPLAMLAGAFLTACEVILIKVLSRHESMLSMLLHVNGFASLILGCAMLFLWVPVEPLTLAALCLIGPMAILGQMCNVRAYRLADAAWLAPFTYSSVAFAALIGWTVFGTLPGLMAWLGTALIVAGGLLLMHRGRST
ncbi:MAG: DMT family transporter [Ferrovibrio sp.]|uniref:DMT family transporter n=1 Tax=Ferrovibrio sp. TaxID=1917215 RepID=UPI0026189578|nr:DMT family transporter [Ferrovibrio sp.]MCW0236201.1 DMT family transporter [Ferrovibrio sp.]